MTNYNRKQNSNSDGNPRPLWIGTVCAVVALMLILGAAGIKKEYDSTKPIKGFTTFLPKTDICSIALSDGDVWAGGAGGLFVLRGVKDFQEEAVGSMSDSEFNSTQAGNTSKQTDTKLSISNSVQAVSGLMEQSSQSTQYYGENQIYNAEEIGKYRYVKAVLADGKRIWVGHDDGLTLIEGDKKTDFTEKDGLPDRRVNALCLDSKDVLWVGTWGGVVTIESLKIQNSYNSKNGLIADMVNVIFEDSSNGMWFGSYVAPRGGISVFYQNAWQRFSTGEGLIHANINAIIEKNDKSVLTGGGLYTKGGGTLFVFEGGTWKIKTHLLKENGLAGAKIRSLMIDSRSRIWVGSEYEGLAVIGQVWNKDSSQVENNVTGAVENNMARQSEILTKKTGLPDNEVKVILEAPDKSIWVGTRNGLVRIV